MKTKIQIKSIFDEVIFEYEKENNTIKDTVEEAVKHKVILCKANLCKANLCGANLIGANLRLANLIDADLRCADMSNADLYYASLRDAYLREANLSNANLTGADLRGADFSFTELSGASLLGANLHFADLHYANLTGVDMTCVGIKNAYLVGVKNIQHLSLNCPSEGSFIGWKKVAGKLVKLEIPEDAKRSSATTNKCRCDKAKVLEITDLYGSNPIGQILNKSQKHELLYKVGEMVYPDGFDDNRWNECSNGIHFFVDKQDAINY